MTEQPDDLVERHARARAGFTRVVGEVDPSRWTAPSPCTDWDARAVVEHVIGFHEMLLLRPLQVRAHRPREDPVARWHATDAALDEALGREGVLDERVDGLGGGPTEVRSLLAPLVSDVLVHTWDLARAAGLDAELDAELCARAYDLAREHADRFAASGMFGEPVPVPDDAPVCDRLLGMMGRDPDWRSPGAR